MTHRLLALSLLLSVHFIPFGGCRNAVRPRSGQNVVLVTIDTLRADRLGAYGYGDARTPHIDALAERGVVFEDVIAQVPLTLPSHASLFTGLNPPTHGVRDNATFRLGDDAETLAEVLKRERYETAAFVGAYVLESSFGLAQGFDSYDDDLPGDPEIAGTISERKAEEVTRSFTTWLEDRSVEKPFFAWLHYFDPHLPYAPPPPHPPGYDGEIAYVDEQIGRLVEALERKGLAENTLLVLTSDHGESLGEHGEKSHGFFVYDSTLRVPLIFAGANTLPRRIAGTVRAIDVFPTVLEALAVEVPDGVHGESLFDRFSRAGAEAPRALPAYAECYAPRLNFHWAPLFAIRDGGYKYIEAPRPELYDLARDPGETKNLVELEPERAERLRSRLAAELERWPDSLSRMHQPDSETVERLRALGYAGSGGSVDPRAPSSPGLADPKDRIHLWTRLQEVILSKAAGDLDEAAKAARSVLEEDPENLLALELLADARARAGAKEEALSLYERILALDFNRPQSHVARGNLFWQTGDIEAAETSFRDALESDPGSAAAHRRLGELLLSAGRAAEAAESFRRAAQNESDAVSTRLGLARSLRSTGRAAEAMSELESLYERNPATPEVVVEYAGALAQGGDVERALSVLSGGPDHADVHYTSSVLLRSRGDMERALAELERALALEPGMAAALHDRGVIFSRTGRLSEGVEALEKAIALRDSAPSRNALGTALCRMERCSEAVVHFERAVELAPDFVEALENLAQAYWIAGRRAEAERAQNRADALKSSR